MALSWNAYDSLLRIVSEQAPLHSAIAPYVKLDALSKLLKLPLSESFYIITRWKINDILLGVSDLDIYPLLAERGIPLYIHNRLHLKLYQYGRDLALCGSANITSPGLGLIEKPNLELSCSVKITSQEQAAVQSLCDQSIRVTDEIYSKFLESTSSLEPPVARDYPEPDIGDLIADRFLISSLPACQSPMTLYQYYRNPEGLPDSSYRDYIHDYNLFQLSPGLSRDEFFHKLKIEFTGQDFVQLVASVIKEKTNCRFGEVNNLIHEHCRDVPLPYRWEIKPATNRLYDWLSDLIDEISWDRPGHSQILRWQ